MTMLCSLLTFFKMEKIKYIYLDATTSISQINKLISLYESFEFVSIDPKDAKKMLASVEDVKKGCNTFRNSKNLPVLITIPEQ